MITKNQEDKNPLKESKKRASPQRLKLVATDLLTHTK